MKRLFKVLSIPADDHAQIEATLAEIYDAGFYSQGLTFIDGCCKFVASESAEHFREREADARQEHRDHLIRARLITGVPINLIARELGVTSSTVHRVKRASIDAGYTFPK
jgi:DNA invertase Pin-like site-specific DNA recombinase